MFRALFTTTTLFVLSTTAMAQTSEIVRVGVDTARNERLVSRSFNGTPLLQTFKFKYSFRSEDHHVRRLGVLQGSQSFLAFLGDKNSDDLFDMRARYLALDHPEIVRGETAAIGEIGRSVKLLDRPHGQFVFVLRGFKLMYGKRRQDKDDKEDHHVDEIGVWEVGGRLHVVLNDKNNDDPFKYKVQYAFVPRHLISSVETASGTAVAADAQPISDGIPLLRGFHVNFRSSDHHLQLLEVETKRGNVKVSYYDKNRDDKFDWKVYTATLKDLPAEPTGPLATQILTLPKSRVSTKFRISGQ